MSHKTAKRPSRNPFVTAKEFVIAWQTSANVDEVVKKTRMSRGSVHGRASAYRANGVMLKPMPKHRGPSIDYAALNELALSLAS